MPDAWFRLASLFEYGIAEADSHPDAFLNRVADEIESLRRKVDDATPFALRA